MIVLKFGGTSVQDAESFRTVIRIVSRERKRQPLVVVSACAGVTHALLEILDTAVHGDFTGACSILNGLAERHSGIAQELLTVKYRQEYGKDLHGDVARIESFITSISLVREASKRTHDFVLSFGERWSARLLTLALSEVRLLAEFIDATTILKTNDDHTRANPLLHETEQNAKTSILPLLQRGLIVVTQGFVGSTLAGAITTVGRGGSDYSAAVLGSVLDAEEIQIWSDVDGILTADPAVVPGAVLLDGVSYIQATELAHYGAKVIHPRTLLPAVGKNIPFRILNSKNINSAGTFVTPSHHPGRRAIQSIASKKNLILIAVHNTTGLSLTDFLQSILHTLSHFKRRVEFLVQSEVGISLLLEGGEDDKELLEELGEWGTATVTGRKAIVCVVGENLPNHAGLHERVFAALSKHGVASSLNYNGVTEHSVAFVVDDHAVDRAVVALHDEFFEVAAPAVQSRAAAV
ncbi:MAG: aspartate kinase [Bacteroidota bacterium]